MSTLLCRLQVRLNQTDVVTVYKSIASLHRDVGVGRIFTVMLEYGTDNTISNTQIRLQKAILLLFANGFGVLDATYKWMAVN